jgi:spore coat protein H
MESIKSISIVFLIISLNISCSNYNFLSGGIENRKISSHKNKSIPNYEVVFPQNKVNRIDITISSSDWKLMQDNLIIIFGGKLFEKKDSNLSIKSDEKNNYLNSEIEEDEKGEPIYVPCDIRFENKIWKNVGIRYKGERSLSGALRKTYKLPFRLDFDEFEDTFHETKNQRFYGFKKLSLSNSFSDDSLIREKVAPDIFRESGVPAAQTAFYRVYIDYGQGSKYFGLYTMVEIPDSPMFQTQFKKDGGNLYKPEGNGATLNTFDEKSFESKTHGDKFDNRNIKLFISTLNSNRDNAEQWRSNLEKIFDVDGFLRYLAVNTFIQNWDTYGQVTHNYYLYNDPADKLIHWIPWDHNMSLSSGSSKKNIDIDISSIDLSNVSDVWPLIRYLIDDPIYKAKYVKNIDDISRNSFNIEKTKDRYQKAYNLIKAYVIGNDGEQEGYTLLKNKDDFEKAFQELNEHLEYRHLVANAYLEANK